MGGPPLPPLPDGLDVQDLLLTLITPVDNPYDLLLAAINSATLSIYVAVFTLNDPTIAAALAERAAAGVPVVLVLDHTQSTTPTEHPVVVQLQQEARTTPMLSVVIATSPVKGRIIHTKAIVVDGWLTIDGSENLTQVALQEVNDVNVIPSRKRAALFIGRIIALRDWALTHEARYQGDALPAEATLGGAVSVAPSAARHGTQA